MPSKVIPVRLGDELLAQVEAELRKRNEYPTATEWNLSDWIRAACREKLAHAKRSRKPRKPKAKPDVELIIITNDPLMQEIINEKRDPGPSPAAPAEARGASGSEPA